MLEAKALELCTEATEITARLASSTDKDAWSNAKNRFWELYWGPLYIIETEEKKRNAQKRSELERAMVAFGKILDDQNSSASSLPARALTQSSLRVALACNALIQGK